MLRALGQRCNLIGLQKFCGRYNLLYAGSLDYFLQAKSRRRQSKCSVHHAVETKAIKER